MKVFTPRGVARAFIGLPFAGLLACNAILGAGDYHVGKGDAGTDDGSGGASADDSGAGGSSAATGGVTGNGGKASGGSANAGGRGPGGGTGGGKATGGATGTGGRGTGGATGTGGRGTGGASGALTPDDFIGEWDCPNEKVVTDCGGGDPSTDMTEDSIQWTTGGTDYVRAVFQGACSLEAALSGRALTISPPITCTDSGITYLISGTFTVGANGTAALDESVTVTTNGVVCNVTATGTYTKYVAP
ncbi:MAG TPA: hypothetical protein VH062_21015 [Polyangiaceae bacterium]|jgi:hypothetical protein|nr:hypothetical protein [Polyangiaceae bacterium]